MASTATPADLRHAQELKNAKELERISRIQSKVIAWSDPEVARFHRRSRVLHNVDEPR